MNDTSTGVLSIPSFEVYGDTVGTFSTTVNEFIHRSKAAGVKIIVLDLQQNAGGDALLAFDTFKQVEYPTVCMVHLLISSKFFPTIDPFGGSRLHAHPMADIIGNTITTFYNTLSTSNTDYTTLSMDEWVATDRLNARTGQNFTDWGSFYGPHPDRGDSFTATVGVLYCFI